MSFGVGNDCLAAQLAATIAFADGASGPSKISFYATTRPAKGADPGGSPLVTVVLAKPCAIISGGTATLLPSPTDTPLILVSGVPLWARWDRSDGKLVADGSVTQVSSTGDFRIDGGIVDSGDDSPTLIPGGLIILGTLTFF